MLNPEPNSVIPRNEDIIPVDDSSRKIFNSQSVIDRVKRYFEGRSARISRYEGSEHSTISGAALRGRETRRANDPKYFARARLKIPIFYLRNNCSHCCAQITKQQ